MEKYSCSLPSFFRKVERKNMAAKYAKIRDGGKGAGLHYRTFEAFSKLVALKLRKLRREDFQITTRIGEVRLTHNSTKRFLHRVSRCVPLKIDLREHSN